MKFISMLLLCLFWTSIPHAQSIETLLTSLFEDYYEETKPGASVLISQNGKVIYTKQIGLANIEHRVAINHKTSFSIGSITKQFTATAILLLEEKGQISLSDTLDKYLPSFNKTKYPITIHQLLTHSSGIPDYPQVAEIRKLIRNNLNPEEIITLVKEEPLLFDPGTQVAYSNTAYIILGLIIEKVSGKSYSNFLTDHIFKPLEMNDSKVCIYEDIVIGRATGYSEDENDEIINFTPHTSSFAAGAIVSTPMDMNKWIVGLFNHKILSKRSLEKMLNKHELVNGQQTNLGLGWELNDIQGYKTYEHSGFIPGFKANSVYVPEKKLYVVVMQNNEYGSPTPSMLNAAAICLGRPYPRSSMTKKISAKMLAKFVGTYEFESGIQRIIGVKDGDIYIKSRGGAPSRLFINNEYQLFYAEGYRQLNFDSNFKQLTYYNRNNKLNGRKISDEIPAEKKAVEIPSQILEKYVGIYNTEAFEITITLENDTLHAQPKGSDKLSLSPESETKFFLSEIGAEITFNLDSDGVTHSIEILLEGNIIQGKKL